ncbi:MULTISPECIES: hypothetical protein [unclassified Rhodococcus (in: high G+C Gram-positive bacteria)]|uniref:hypothetical protein n=1 Tax=unclassified Rhodococcus (in: high G+C Gram-positive bacteria) TaxID=192944 RepID=UPI001639AB84|nr:MULTISPECIES: hypothetical protein [unclassified Rhodococcus (in: high G+C Gram-positive bacteria)]MBC2642972.1 hypothetical protein [Rhodococcus sp. 3A]MBC2892286.1 hypothetical protein [Rhodococcus sp. 4CII]
MTSTLNVQIERIWRRRVLVLVITALAVLGAVAAVKEAGASYTGRAALIVSSPGRAPEQDAILVVGYVDYFNNGPYQERIRAQAGVPDDVAFAASTAAASPIMYIDATANDPETAATAATAMAGAFRDDVNAVRFAGRADTLDELRQQLDQQRSSPQADPVAMAQLQDRITAIELDTTNELQDQQLAAGVAEQSPSLIRNAVLGLFGGLILGCVAALALDAVSKRLTTAADVRGKIGVETLVEVPRGGKPRAEQRREEQFRRLANIVGLADLPRPATLVVTAPRRTEGVAQVVRAIAEHRAIQGERSLILWADLRSSEHTTNVDGAPGVADFLAAVRRPGIAGFIQESAPGAVPEMPPGTEHGDPYALFTRERFGDLLHHAHNVADVVVVEAPPITEAAEAQVMCAAADAVVLVVERGTTRVPETVEACRLLGQVGSRLLGAVIIDPRCTPRSVPTPSPDESAYSDDLDTVDLVKVRESASDQTAHS